MRNEQARYGPLADHEDIQQQIYVEWREQVGGKTKIHAMGKVNGGGERVELYAEDGGIQISARAVPATP